MLNTRISSSPVKNVGSEKPMKVSVLATWSNSEYDAAYKAAQVELDPVKRAALFIKMNDLVVQNRAIIAVVSRPRVRASNLRLKVPESGWDSDFWALQDWYREGTPPA